MNGARMRELRKLAGLRMKEVAEELGVSVDTIHRWERGGELPKLAARGMGELVGNIERVHWIKTMRKKVDRSGNFKGRSGEVEEGAINNVGEIRLPNIGCAAGGSLSWGITPAAGQEGMRKAVWALLRGAGGVKGKMFRDLVERTRIPAARLEAYLAGNGGLFEDEYFELERVKREQEGE